MEGCSEPTPPTDRRPPEQSKAPSRILWGSLACALLFAVVGISVVGILGWKDNRTKPVLQVVRLTYKTPQGSTLNQSAVTDRRRSTITYRVTSSRNQTSVVLFDSKHSLVCYRAAGERSCFLRRMEPRDLENIQSIGNGSEPKDEGLLPQNNRTRYYREFLGVLGGRRVNPGLVGEPVQTLCDQLPIYWVKKSEGPARQRLIYLCIDICFPSNICVSVCFYYLPD
ncbi:BRICHOS domain-containing protein 5 isoform X1 [Ascaphus truei]|uniref:BRICHOS domain-containing protein 5 isoform X1 n=1 Tax=Ascaphus truei TaxID=8439 RepID=UPI003F5A1F39